MTKEEKENPPAEVPKPEEASDPAGTAGVQNRTDRLEGSSDEPAKAVNRYIVNEITARKYRQA
ncbi:MAG: hypothetical protein PHE06_03595 [Lachnospiraceae bacterium]|nr:hypothetical protein [Lachnospiraceae bacterium]MDD3795048.1 hypothetical protein [Lachnospiraceae bacterium]